MINKKEKEKKIDATVDSYDSVLSPVITEKATMASQYNQVTFKVSINSSKPEIKKAEENQAIDDLRLEAALEWDKGNLEHATALYDLATKQEEMIKSIYKLVIEE